MKEYTIASVEDPDDPGEFNDQAVSVELYAFDQATGQKRTITTQALNGNNDLANPTYNPQNQTVVVTRADYGGGENYVETYDYKSGQLISSVLVSSGAQQKEAHSQATVFALPPDLSQNVKAIEQNVTTIEKNVAALGDRVDHLDSQVAQLQNRDKEHTEGLAAVASLAQPMILPGQRFAVRAGWGGFDDASAVSFTAAGVLAQNVLASGRGSVVLDGGIGVGTAQGGVAGRAGLSFGW